MSVVDTLLSPLRSIAAAETSPTSVCSVWSVGVAIVIAFAWIAWRRRRRGRRVRMALLFRAVFSRRVLLHRSTRADLAYAFLTLTLLGTLIGSAVISTAWVAGGAAAALAAVFGEARPRPASLSGDAARTLAVFLAYDLGFFVDHTLKHRFPALWELHKTHHSAEALTPLVNFRVHPLDSLILANTLALFIGVGGGIAAYAFGRNATSFSLFDVNVLMLAYIYLTAQLQHSQIWIPFTGFAGRLFMSPAHHQLHHSADPAHFNCNMGASLAVWDWIFGSLRLPSSRSPRLTYGVSGFDHDPHGVAGLLIEPAVKFALSVIPLRLVAAAGSARGRRLA